MFALFFDKMCATPLDKCEKLSYTVITAIRIIRGADRIG